MLNYDNIYKKFSNTTINWLGSDSQERYKNNIKRNYNLLKQNKWIDNHFTYQFNNYGFRCDQFTTDPTILFLGGSDVFGIGLPKDTLWAEIVAKKLNMKCANLGVGAGSNDTAFRLCHGWINRLDIKMVFLLPPPPARLELIHENTITNILPTDNLRFNTFLLSWLTDHNNAEFNALKNHLAIENLCRIKNIKFLNLKPLSEFRIKDDLARDLLHLGINSNRNFANYAISLV